MNDKKGSSVAKLVGNKIFIVLLAFSIAVIFISFAFNKSIKKVSTIQEEEPIELPVVSDVVNEASEDIFVEEVIKEEIPEEITEETITYRLPVAGELQKKFSSDELLWDETMQDWRTHMGVDIEAEDGAEVVTAAKGIVMEAYKDEMYGFTVKVSHNDGCLVDLEMNGKGNGCFGTVPFFIAPYCHFVAYFAF